MVPITASDFERLCVCDFKSGDNVINFGLQSKQIIHVIFFKVLCTVTKVHSLKTPLNTHDSKRFQ